ncbi:Ig-like domain-containing protein [Streptomyces sp. NPDC127068]|uniref:L,D-transpeptidase n=1 Tax=Streptomyces sp. NPDC127068 TaxID=3347127 RepID=UPI0036648D28
MSHSPRTRTVLSCTMLVVTLVAGATACGGTTDHPLSAAPYDAASQVVLGTASGRAKLDPDRPLEITAKQGAGGRITDVTATDAAGRYVAGKLSADGTRWHTTVPLAAGAHYTARVSTEKADGSPGRKVVTFDTGVPAKKRELKVTFGPDEGKYGVGQPIIAELSEPIEDKKARAAVERGLRVESQPAVEGAWHWLNDEVLHYRPKEYWPVNATITARSTLDGIKVGERLWGGESAPLKLTTGDRIVAVTDASSHYMTVYRNGEEINSIPVTTGKPGFSTRNGIKVVLGKEYFVRMRGTSIGIAAGTSESYDLPVYYATRVTWSGEYVHAAPWSLGSHGAANVSHGCTGMSTGNAAWFYETVRPGDLVKVINSYGEEMDPFGNGYGDWNLDWKEWQEGSAVHGTGAPRTPPAAQQARLRPGT